MSIAWPKLLLSILISLSAGFVGSLFTTTEIPGWYQTLEKPFFNPPNWIFAPVWTVLYILMGVSLYLVWNKSGVNRALKKKAYSFFFLQLFLNTLWSIIFFGLHAVGVALAEIIVLWGLIAITIYFFRKISKPAAYLLIPYLAWVSFATVLNLAIVLLNF